MGERLAWKGDTKEKNLVFGRENSHWETPCREGERMEENVAARRNAK